MASRLKLQAILEEILNSDQVFFQPPENVKMIYPAIVYNLDYVLGEHADNHPYRLTNRYELTLLERKADSDYLDKLLRISGASYTRYFAANSLHHHILSLYF